MPDSSVCTADRSHRGEGLVAALREVPALFFQEDFALER